MRWEKTVIFMPEAILLNCWCVKWKRDQDWCQGCGEVLQNGLHPQMSVVCLDTWGALLDHIFQYIPAKGIHLTRSKIACNAQQCLVCEESLINGDWQICFNSTFLNQTKILMQTQLGCLVLCLFPVHYFLNFYSQYYGLSGYFPGFQFILLLSSVGPGSNHFPAPPHVSLVNSHISSLAPAILLTRLCPFCITCFYSHLCNLIFYR